MPLARFRRYLFPFLTSRPGADIRMTYRILADAVLIAHALFVAWVVFRRTGRLVEAAAGLGSPTRAGLGRDSRRHGMDLPAYPAGKCAAGPGGASSPTAATSSITT